MLKVAETCIERAGQRLTAGDQSPSPSSTIPIVFFAILLGLVLNKGFNNLFDVANLNQDILGFQIRMNDATFSMHIVKAQ